MESITGRRAFLAVLRPGPAATERLGLLVGGTVLAGLAVIDATLLTSSSTLIGTYMLAPFASAVFGAVLATAVVAVAAFVVGIASGHWTMVSDNTDYWVRLAGLVVGGAFALFGARALARSRLNAGRLQVLNEVATVADGSLALRETLARVVEVIVPAAADLCMVDVVSEGRVMRAAVRAGGHPRAVAAEEGIRRRQPSLPEWMVDDVPQWRHLSRLMPRMRDEDLKRMANDEPDLEFLRWLGPRSSIATPLIARGRSLGALTMVSVWSRRHYTPDDVRFAEILARRLGMALDNAGIFSNLESVERRLDAVMSMVGEAVVVHDATGRLVFANLAAARLLGLDAPRQLTDAREETLRARLMVLDEEGLPLDGESLPGLGLAPALTPWRGLRRVIVAGSATERWVNVATEEIRGPNNEALYRITTIADVTEVKRAELAQRLLAEAGELLASSLDHRGNMTALAERVVPEFADWCAVTVQREDGAVEQLTSAIAEGMSMPGEGAAAGEPGRERLLLRAYGVIRTGEPLLSESLPGETVRTGDAQTSPSEAGSVMIAPMSAGDAVFGALSFANAPAHGAFDEADLAVARELARRAGVAFANARLANERAEVARTLQEGLLPPQLPEMRGWRVAAMYRPAGEVNDVGGDFYDAFAYDGGWMIMVGDVLGRGARAASVTALARYTIRTAGMLTGDPRTALAMLDAALGEERGASLCTAVILAIPDSDEERIRATVACAGHPPPLVVRPRGIEELRPGGAMLGAIEHADWPLQTVELGRGDQIVLYTDGVIEAKGAVERFGTRRLRDGLAGASSPAIAIAGIERSLEGFLAAEPDDDAAAVVVQRTADTWQGDRLRAEVGSAGG